MNPWALQIVTIPSLIVCKNSNCIQELTCEGCLNSDVFLNVTIYNYIVDEIFECDTFSIIGVIAYFDNLNNVFWNKTIFLVEFDASGMKTDVFLSS